MSNIIESIKNFFNIAKEIVSAINNKRLEAQYPQVKLLRQILSKVENNEYKMKVSASCCSWTPSFEVSFIPNDKSLPVFMYEFSYDRNRRWSSMYLWIDGEIEGIYDSHCNAVYTELETIQEVKENLPILFKKARQYEEEFDRRQAAKMARWEEETSKKASNIKAKKDKIFA